MEKELRRHIEYLLCIKLANIKSVSGGDTSKTYLLETDSERFFCKVNSTKNASQMFQAEKVGLEAIAKTKTIAVPKVLLLDTLEVGALLLLEYIEPKRPALKDMEGFGHQLAALHELSSSETFGWYSDNFIGNLPQSNIQNQDWVTFYVQQRLLPQLRMARDGERLTSNEIPSESQLLKSCERVFPEVKPSLLHGDLWSGNYLIAQTGILYLIDPSVYYGHHEIDIAMTRLFGGFENTFYDAYREHFPAIGGETERSDLYQLYYLLVHLNLFGVAHKASITHILSKYF